MMQVYKLAVLILGSAPTLAWAGGTPVTLDQQREFELPSHNICCTYTPPGGTSTYMTPDGSAELSCHRVEPSYWILSFTGKGKLSVNKSPGEVPGCGNADADVLGYGQKRIDGPFTCAAKTSGLSCRLHNGKGFTLSKSGYKALH